MRRMIRIRYYIAMTPYPLSKEGSADAVEKSLRQLRQFSLDQPFDSVSDFERVVKPRESKRFPNQYFKRLKPSMKLGFSAGLGSDKPFDLFLHKYPRFGRAYVPWFIDGCCWQGPVPDSLFISRHLAIIAVLDKAKRMGFEVEVKDGSGYWKHRSKERLLATRRLLEALPDPMKALLRMSDNKSFGNVNQKL